jgi:hypothetical protein
MSFMPNLDERKRRWENRKAYMAEHMRKIRHLTETQPTIPDYEPESLFDSTEEEE